jgi:hypothetical protein
LSSLVGKQLSGALDGDGLGGVGAAQGGSASSSVIVNIFSSESSDRESVPFFR